MLEFLGDNPYRINTYRRVALMSPQKLTLWERREDDPLKVVEEYFSDCHIVILEGWKSLEGAKVYRIV